MSKGRTRTRWLRLALPPLLIIEGGAEGKVGGRQGGLGGAALRSGVDLIEHLPGPDQAEGDYDEEQHECPEVVKTAMRMKADTATEGPESQSHQLTPRSVPDSSAAGGELMPTAPARMWKTHVGSWNQFGPVIPSSDGNLFTAPVALNRNSHKTVMATGLVTEGK